MKPFSSVREELLFIKEQNEGNFLNPHEVIDFAKNPKTKLHSKFEWDDTKAAHEHRLEQARKIIRLELKVVDSGKKEKATHLFVSLKDDREKHGGYRLITDVIQDEELYAKLLNEALSELERIKKKYKDLKELSRIFKAIEELEMELVN